MTLEAFPMTTIDPTALGNALLQRLREAVAAYEVAHAKVRALYAGLGDQSLDDLESEALDEFEEAENEERWAEDDIKDTLTTILNNRSGGFWVGGWFYALVLRKQDEAFDKEENDLQLCILDPANFFALGDSPTNSRTDPKPPVLSG
jgi:hypothetical protein